MNQIQVIYSQLWILETLERRSWPLVGSRCLLLPSVATRWHPLPRAFLPPAGSRCPPPCCPPLAPVASRHVASCCLPCSLVVSRRFPLPLAYLVGSSVLCVLQLGLHYRHPPTLFGVDRQHHSCILLYIFYVLTNNISIILVH